MERSNKFSIAGLLLLSCAINSIGINWIAIPNGFVVTGITGLSMTIEQLTDINYAMVSYLITAVVLLITVIVINKEEVRNIIMLSVMYPAVLWIMSYFPVAIVFEEKLIAVAICGVLYGVGTGIAYKKGFSYGGTDTIGKILKRTVLKSIPFKNILFLIDIAIVLLMLMVYDFNILAYAFIGQVIYVYSLNHIIFRTGPKLYEIQIVSTDTKLVERFILKIIKKGVTCHDVVGGYTKEAKKQLDCVCTSKEYLLLKEYIKQEDINCFIKVFPLMHVYGQNKDFKNIDDEVE